MIAVDAQRQISQAYKALDRVAMLGKPIVAMFLTHEHPDHHGGLAAFRDRGVKDMPIYCSHSTKEAIEKDERGFNALARQILKNDFSGADFFPAQILAPGADTAVGGIVLRHHDLGPGESSSMSGFEIVDSTSLFCGDLVANRMSPFLFEGRSRLWIEQLTRFPATFSQIEMMYCGHGVPAAASELIPLQLKYLREFRSHVEAAVTKDKLSDEQKYSIRAVVEAQYPGYQPVAEIPNYLEGNATAVAAEIGRQRSL